MIIHSLSVSHRSSLSGPLRQLSITTITVFVALNLIFFFSKLRFGPSWPPSWQISGVIQSKEEVILQEEELCIGGGGHKAATQIIRCRPSPWARHGQQRKWAGVLRWCVGQSLQWQLWAAGELCRGLQDGRGQLQVQWLYWGEKRSWRSCLSE